jgi:hypothetical protein
VTFVTFVTFVAFVTFHLILVEVGERILAPADEPGGGRVQGVDEVSAADAAGCHVADPAEPQTGAAEELFIAGLPDFYVVVKQTKAGENINIGT